MINPTATPLLGDLGSTVNVTGAWFPSVAPQRAFQGTVTGTGAVTATLTIQCSNDGVNACATALGTITLSGTSPQCDGFQSDARWLWVRAVLTNLTGTGATAKVGMSESLP